MEIGIAVGLTNGLMVKKFQLCKIKSDTKGTYIVVLQVETGDRFLGEDPQELAVEPLMKEDLDLSVCEFLFFKSFHSGPRTGLS